ncbi:GNAT family N-acetyltransferase [Streptomyces sp. NPDC051219]|uniref:GNAT family N-acetyltransferase n=1 Tax=Streptomyces sp. NPDC051219 TaxID=3155283 RepID=UPI00342C1885
MTDVTGVTPGVFTLRPWRTGDAAAVLTAFGRPEMARQAGRPVTTPAEAAEWIVDRSRDRVAGTGYSWAVTDGTDAVLGCVAVTAVNRTHDTGWISYWTVKAARGRGVASAGLCALARWAFDDLGLFRLELGHRTNNPASCAVAMRAGFAVEGLERARLRYGDVRYDVERHARLATDPVPLPGAPG